MNFVISKKLFVHLQRTVPFKVNYAVAAIKNFKNNNLVDKHVAPLGHIIPILSQPAFTFTPYCSVLGGEATHTNCIVFGLTRLGHGPTIYSIRYENASHATDADCSNCY
jgi:hypothetical protein